MSKPISQRTHKKNAEHNHARKSADQIRADKCQKSKARTATMRLDRLVTAQERQLYWESLTPTQQLAALDDRLGKGVGAVKQRKRIQGLIESN